MRLLCAKDVDVNRQDTNGNTALHMVAIHDHEVRAIHATLSSSHTLLERIAVSKIERQSSRKAALFQAQEEPMFSGLRSKSMAPTHVR